MKPSASRMTLALIALTLAYAFGLQFLPQAQGNSWQAIALLNSGLALASLFLWKTQAIPSPRHRDRKIAWALGPALFSANIIAIIFSLVSDGPPLSTYSFSILEILGLCLWIPVIEEIIFRRFISEWIGLHWEDIGCIYFSGLIFALAHTSPPVNPWPPLGPFLLGCACTWAYRASGRILPPILLHAACNLSAVLFTAFAPSWLTRLSWLYQKL